MTKIEPGFVKLPTGWSLKFDERNSSSTSKFYDLLFEHQHTALWIHHCVPQGHYRLSGADFGFRDRDFMPWEYTMQGAANQLVAHLVAERMTA